MPADWPVEPGTLRQQLDRVTKLAGEADVDRIQSGDAAAFDGRSTEADAERDLRQDGELVGGIGPIDVQGRVGLGVAAPLGLGQRIGVAAAMSPISVRMKLDVPLRMPCTATI